MQLRFNKLIINVIYIKSKCITCKTLKKSEMRFKMTFVKYRVIPPADNITLPCQVYANY